MPQARQVTSDTAPADTEYLPAPHKVQADNEVAPNNAEYVPAPHMVHSLSPTSGLYLPSEHPTQVLLTLVKPALHWQEAWPDGLSALDGHAKQLPLPGSDL
jgi:hypothetical protein